MGKTKGSAWERKPGSQVTPETGNIGLFVVEGFRVGKGIVRFDGGSYRRCDDCSRFIASYYMGSITTCDS